MEKIRPKTIHFHYPRFTVKMTGAREKATTGILEFLISCCGVFVGYSFGFSRIMFGSHWKNFSVRKKLLIGGVVFLSLLFFAAPWLWIDNGEDVLESKLFRGREMEIFSKHIPECRESCDGSCYRLKWVPFGVKVSACTADYYFVSFWGQKFYID